MNHVKHYILLCFILFGLFEKLYSQSNTSDDACHFPELQQQIDSVQYYFKSGQSVKTIELSNTLLKNYTSENCLDVVKIKLTKGFAYEVLFKYEKSIKIYLNLLKITQEKNFKAEEADVRMYLARAYEIVKRKEKALENLNEAKKIIDANNFQKRLAEYYVRLASFHRIFNDGRETKFYIDKALQIGLESKNLEAVAGAYMVLGIITEDFEQSNIYTSKCIDLLFQLGDNIGAIYQKLNMGRRHINKGNLETAAQLFDSVDAYTDSIQNNDKLKYNLKQSLYSSKIILYRKTGETEKLIDALTEEINYTKLFGNLANQEMINQVILDNEITIEREKSAATKQQNKLLYISLSCLLLILFCLFLLILSNKRKTKKIQELYEYKTTLLNETHHRIKNNLQLIVSLIVLQNYKLKDATFEENTKVLIKRINSISLIHEQLYNTNTFDKLDFSKYSEELLKHFEILFKEQKVAVNHNSKSIILNLETTTPLGLILSELISNSLKYNSKKLTISYSLTEENEMYTFYYHDNGKGYPDDKFTANESGIGYTIIDNLSKQLDAVLETYNDNGAHFILKFKEKEISPL